MRGASRLRGGPALVRAVAAACLLAGSAALLTACGHALGAAGGIHVSGASIPLPAVPGRADAYLDIRNNGPADQLVSAQTSEGGTVTFSAPAPGSSAMHTVPDIPVPSHATLRLVPNGAHLTITGARALPGGTQIMLTLVFAKAGKVSVPAVIADSPAS
jgi:copper(I)-binding protein